MSLIKKINDPNGKKYDDFSIGSLVLDTEPIPGSFNTVTSDAVVKAVDKAKEDMQEKIDEVTLDPSAVALGNVHLLDEVTAFPADGCILVDSETNGPGEMSKGTLLDITAENSGKVNKFYGIPFYVKKKGYLNKNTGEFTVSSSYHCLITPKIPTEPGKVFLYRGRGASSAASAAFFKADGSFLSAVQYNVRIEQPINERLITMPENTAFVQFCSYESDESVLDLSVTLKDCPKYKNKTYLQQAEVDSSQIKYRSYPGYFNRFCSLIASSDYKCVVTDLLAVKQGQVFLLKAKSVSQGRVYVFLDSNLDVVDTGFFTRLSLYTPVVIPSGVSYVAFSSMEETSSGADPFLDVQLASSTKVLDDCQKNYNAVYAGSCKIFENVGYLLSTGILSTSADYKCVCTDFISVKVGMKFKYRGVGRTNACSVVFFDASFGVVSSSQYESPFDYTEITIPSGVSYALFSSFVDVGSGDALQFDLKVIGSPSASVLPNDESVHDYILADKVWYACGDSFTAGAFNGGTEPHISGGKYNGYLGVYPYLIGNRTLCDVRNIAVSGSSLGQPSDPEYADRVVFTKPSTGLLYATDFSDADYITIYYGINDFNHGVPVGNIDDATNDTYFGAWNITMAYLTEHYPNAKIGIIITNGCAGNSAYPEAAKSIAQKWGVPYLDLDGGVGCQTMLRCSERNPASDSVKAAINERQRVSSTNMHPNALAHQLESTFIEAWLKSL